VTDEQLIRWTHSNDSALNDVSADCQDARAEIATLRAKLAAVCEAGSATEARDRAIVAKAGPWFYYSPGTLEPVKPNTQVEADHACRAAARILNRIVREEAKRGKGRR
jgi:hypothetical protein